MIRASYDELVDRIVKAGGISKEEVDSRVKEKRDALSGLVSLEGAAQIVANELGVKFDEVKVKVGELLIGARGIEVVGKIVSVSPIRTYTQKGGSEGKIGNFVFADESGSVEVVLWDTNHIALFEGGEVKEGDVVLLRGADVRGTDIKELHLSSKSSLEKSGEVIGEVKVSVAMPSKKIGELREGDRTTVRAAVVRVFQPNFFPVCPECGKRVVPEDEKHHCSVHGEIIPGHRPVLGFFIDDGFSNIRAVCFFEGIVKLFDSNEEEVLGLRENLEKFEELKERILLEEFFLEGRVRKNAMFDRLEFAVSNVAKVNEDELIAELEKRAESGNVGDEKVGSEKVEVGSV